MQHRLGIEKDIALSQPASAIDFYFDFSSPYAYLASELIEALALRFGREVNWHPVLLGAAFKATGSTLPARQPLKGEYVAHDCARSARFLGVPFTQPANFPVSTQHAARAYLWMAEQDRAMAKSFAQSVFRAYFTAGREIDKLDTVLEIAAAQGISRATLAEALSSVAIKEQLYIAIDRALARGVFGTPFFIVDEECFWGCDRLPQLERWLAEGGF